MNIKKFPNPNPNGRLLVDCLKCNKRVEHHAKGLCFKCYKKGHKTKKIKCKECGRIRHHKAFGLCGSCHTRLYHYNYPRNYQFMKLHGLSLEEVEKLTKSCVSCGFDKIVQLHHIDGNKESYDQKNLVGLCPNCHKMIHSYQYYKEIKEILSKKGYDVTHVHPSNYVYRRDEKA